MKLFTEYEDQVSPVAILAEDFSRVQAVKLASAYEVRYQKSGLLKEFLRYTIPFVQTGFLQKYLQTLTIEGKVEGIW